MPEEWRTRMKEPLSKPDDIITTATFRTLPMIFLSFHWIPLETEPKLRDEYVEIKCQLDAASCKPDT